MDTVDGSDLDELQEAGHRELLDDQAEGEVRQRVRRTSRSSTDRTRPAKGDRQGACPAGSPTSTTTPPPCWSSHDSLGQGHPGHHRAPLPLVGGAGEGRRQLARRRLHPGELSDDDDRTARTRPGTTSSASRRDATPERDQGRLARRDRQVRAGLRHRPVPAVQRGRRRAARPGPPRGVRRSAGRRAAVQPPRRSRWPTSRPPPAAATPRRRADDRVEPEARRGRPKAERRRTGRAPAGAGGTAGSATSSRLPRSRCWSLCWRR